MIQWKGARSLPVTLFIISYMKITNWFMKKQLWVKGGIIGMAVCMGLFVFYSLYFPVVARLDTGGELSPSELILPTITGHAVVGLTFFMIEGSSIPAIFCKATETHCNEWSLLPDQGGIPWMDPQTGVDGYCLRQETVPETSCVDRVENGAFLISILLLEGIYFGVGAGIGAGIQWKRNRKK